MGELAFSDILRAIDDRSPELGDLLIRYLAQDDPEPGHPELPVVDVPDDLPAPEIPEGAWTLQRLQDAISARGLRGKTATERKLARREAFEAVADSHWAPPRLRLGAILVDLYSNGDDAAREALIQVFSHAELPWGAWQAAKAIYKRAEEGHDAVMFGALAFRFDEISSSDTRGEVGPGTLIYLRRRARRYLMALGRAVPEAYPHFAVEVLRHYRPEHRGHLIVAGALLGHGLDERGGLSDKAFGERPFAESWRLSPAPLLRLLEGAQNNAVAAHAIRALRLDHPLALRAVDPAWLVQLGARPFGAVHGFVVSLLKDNPDLHASKLRERGLHDTVIGFLQSPDATAVAYALDYARANAPDLPLELLMDLLEASGKGVNAFAAARVEELLPTLSLPVVVKLLSFSSTHKAALARLTTGFQPAELAAADFADAWHRSAPGRKAILGWYGDQKQAIPAGHWQVLLANVDDRDHQTLRAAMTDLGKRPAAEIGVAWIQGAVQDDDLVEYVSEWLTKGKLSGDELDVDWLKSLADRPGTEDLALELMADRKIVSPTRLGLEWLLDQARSSDPARQAFAQGLLLEGFAPADFSGEGMSGVDRLWSLAAGKTRKEPVRTFAALYLRAHHPGIGPHHSELKGLGIKPRLGHADFTAARIRPLLDDERVDVRRLGVALAKEELPRWNDVELLYAMAGSRHREPRQLACELLLAASDPAAGGDPLPAAWIDARRLFVLAESPQKLARETALTVIRRCYDRVGAPERLAWLMESTDRDVRLFAVRLFWERHRPRPGAEPGAFDDVAALRQFLRTVLYGLPPGRVERRGGPEAGKLPERPLAASVAKRRLVESIRDLGVAQLGFAQIVAPVLTEFTLSEAKGEWQACVAALTALRAAHGRASLESAP